MNNFSCAGMVNSSIPPLPSPQHINQENFKSELASVLSSRPESLPCMDIKPMNLDLDLKSRPDGVSPSDWHNPASFMGPGNPFNHHSNSIPLPVSSSSATLQQPLPPQEMSTSAALQPPLCAGCRLRIVDKFYLCAVESKWHTACLKCVECGVELENQSSCFERDGQIYCKEDYVR